MLHGIYLLIYKQFVFLKFLAPKKIFGPTRDEVLYVKKSSWDLQCYYVKYNIIILQKAA